MYSMDYEMLEAIYTELTKKVDEMVNSIKEAKDVVDKMNNNDHWKGNGYEEFQNKFSAISNNFGADCNEIYKINNNIKTSIEKIKMIDSEVISSIKM